MVSSTSTSSIDKPVAVVTGCSEINSLGAAFCLNLLSRGWIVYATARNQSTLKELAEKGCQTLELDVTSDESVQKAAEHVRLTTSGRVNLLINNAGATGAAPLIHTDPARLAAMHDLHVLGPLRLVQAFYPLMSTSTGHRAVVNIGSVISNGMPWHAAYATTKAGTQVLSDVMRRELAPYNFKVITVELGAKEFPLAFQPASGATYDGSAAMTQAAKEFKEAAKSSPMPATVAQEIITAVESGYSGKLYLGSNKFLFRNILPHVPTFLQDKLFHRLLRVDLVKG